MASNSTNITDQDGDFADWLELYNPDPAPVNLNGWFLTNKTTNLMKWTDTLREERGRECRV